MKKLIPLFIVLFIFVGCETINEPQSNIYTLSKNSTTLINGSEVTFLGILEKTHNEPNHLLRFDHFLQLEVDNEFYEFILEKTYYYTNNFSFQIVNISNNELTILL